MPVSIVQVINYANGTLHYHNLKSGYKFDVAENTLGPEASGLIPSSNFYNDPVPLRQGTDDDRIKVWLDDGPRVDISDYDFQFYVSGPVRYAEGNLADLYGDLEDGGKYILRLDEIYDGGTRTCGFTFLKYEEKLRVTTGYIGMWDIQHATSIAALISMTICPVAPSDTGPPHFDVKAVA